MRLVSAYKPVTVGTVAISIAKSDAALLAKVNASLAKLKASGTSKILEMGTRRPTPPDVVKRDATFPQQDATPSRCRSF